MPRKSVKRAIPTTHFKHMTASAMHLKHLKTCVCKMILKRESFGRMAGIQKIRKTSVLKMRKLCAVPGCSSGGEAPGHKFLKSVEKSELWAKAIKNYSLLEVSMLERQTYKVCYKHFPDDAYMVGKYRRLFPKVIPSLNLPEFEGGMEEIPIPGSSQIGSIEFERREETEQGEVLDTTCNVTHYDVKIEDTTQEEMPQPESDVIHFEILTAQSKQGKILEERHDGLKIVQTRGNAPHAVPEHSPDISNSPLGFCTMCTQNIERERKRTTKNCDLTPRGLRLFKEIKKIARKQRYAHQQNKTLRQKLKLLKKVSRPQFLQQYAQLSESQKLLIDMQLRTSENAPQGRRYTMDEKIVSLSIVINVILLIYVPLRKYVKKERAFLF